MNDSIKPDDIDPVIHERVRLAIVSALAVAPEMSFNDLKATLELSDGNLSVHLQKLEEAEYVKIDKVFVERRPKTWIWATTEGRDAFAAHVDALEAIVAQARS